MKILIAAIYGINSYSRGIMPDWLQTQIDEFPEADIHYLTCSNSFDLCYFNKEKQPDICYRCKTGVKNSLQLIEGNYQHIKIDDIIKKEHRLLANRLFKEYQGNYFDLVYDNFEVGEASLSTYISITRDRYLTKMDEFPVRELVENALCLYLGIRDYIAKYNFNIVYNFNGRQEYVRAVLKASLAQGIDCWNLERPSLGGNIEFFKNTLPQDIKARWQNVEKNWKDSPLTVNEKEELGREFFDRKRIGEGVNMPSYVATQTEGELPSFIDEKSENIVVFTSSDDEYAALGDHFKNPFFKDQNEGLSYLAELVGKDFKQANLIIRMHPNLQYVNFDYVSYIKKLDQIYPNVHVIGPTSSIHTYALMKIASKVVVFGSTTGMEASLIGKPVILLGKCYYFYQDFVYVPDSKLDIKDLLSARLSSKASQDILKFGYYYLDGGVKAKYYFEDRKGKGIFLKGKRVFFYKFTQRLKAKIIQLIYWAFKIRIA
ncbi:capsular polysaccharide biosynthesis protein [Salegentibacter sp. 24]|uniref:capsular polysaccharide export protein, LipB/KpsS family n=1 Tax=Salegentibacter sp. 24 TaxID=2183986 RepID=UPI0010621120|nr:hypothetical protein [Salegentibacter sp. 24]TDN82172.1 capsular polysaccharide biosynthesis protein [Salegentibacter sp. 24]